MIQWINVPSSGVYDRPLQAQLAAHVVPFARNNLKQASRFAEGIGQLAKTNKVDAAVLARMGSLLDLEAEKPRAQSANDLKDLATARQALIKDRATAKYALKQRVPLLKAQFISVSNRSNAISRKSRRPF